MKRSIVSFVAAPLAVSLGLFAAALAGPAAGAATVRAPEQQKLPNGLRVVVFPRPGAGFVQVQLTVEAGTAAEGAQQRGAAPLVAQLLRSGTSSRSGESFGEDIDRLGGNLAASASRENAAVGAAFLPEDLEAGLELMSDAVINPIFDEEAFQRTRNQAVRELVRLHADPVATAEEQLWQLAMPGVPAAREPLGDLASLFALTRESLRSFHRDAWRPDRAVLTLAGDVTAQRAFAVAAEWFGRWSGRGVALPVARGVTGEGTRIRLIDRPDQGLASVRMGWRLPGRDASDDLARTVAASLLNEALVARLAGKLPGEAALGVSLHQVRGASLLDVRCFVPADSVPAAIERVRRALRQLRDAPPDESRRAALVQQARAAYPLRFGSAGGAMAQWLSADAPGVDAQAALASYPDRVTALDGAAISAALQREWNLDRIAIVVIGPAAKLRAPLAKLGTVSEVKLDAPPSVSTAAADSLPPPTAADEKLGRERVARALVAHGGLAKLSAVGATVSEARIRLVLQGHELRGELRQIRKEPLKMVYLTQFESFESRQVLNGNRAWSVTPDGRLQDADSIGVRALQSGFGSDLPHLLVAAADPASQVADRGTVRIGGKDLWAIEVAQASGQRRRLYLDPATAQLAAMDQNEDGARGRLVARRLYRDLRTVDGVLVPFEEERQIDGQTVMQVFVTRFELNSEISDLEFERPASMPSEPVKK